MSALLPGCTGKHPYRTALRAWRVVTRNKAWYGRRKCRVLGVYKCPVCHAWHIGKSFKSARAAFKWED